ncbi:MAG: hypothetical protein ABJA74_04065 [Lapillicoccus sp.]
MSDATTGQVTVAAAEAYERDMVSELFAQWPGRLLDVADVHAGHTVLDVGLAPVSSLAPLRLGSCPADPLRGWIPTRGCWRWPAARRRT